MQQSIRCVADYSKDGRGVFIRNALSFRGQRGLFVRYGQKLLLGKPAGKVDAEDDVVGWIPESETKRLGKGEWIKSAERAPSSRRMAPPLSKETTSTEKKSSEEEA